jgi:phosphoribosylpyrophosphate synthetase
MTAIPSVAARRTIVNVTAILPLFGIARQRCQTKLR